VADALRSPAIAARAVSVELGGAVILDRVSVTVRSGELLAVVGPNGAGKTTLLRCLDGLQAVTGGAVEVSGRPLAALTRRALAREVSYVPQVAGGLGELSVEAFVELGRYPHLGPWQEPGTEDLAALRDALEVTETDHLASRRLDTLSGGERQRVLIAAALAQGGKILLLDEPTASLDYRHQAQTLALLSRLHRERGLTFVLVSHDLNAALPEADRVLALKRGRVAYLGAPGGLLDPEVLAAIYDASFALVRDDHGEVLILPRRQR
jgi:iron complex transport system ATP-binding protein